MFVLKSKAPWLFLVAVAMTATPCDAETARGRVYHDENGNGAWDVGEPGIPGVGVSNGADVVASDSEGKYTLELDSKGGVFVIKPSGWQVSLDPKTKLPRHYYMHRPDGSPALKYPGVAPTGALPSSIDFPLAPHDETGAFTALCFGDTQPRNQQEVDYISHDILEELIGTDVAFGMTLGDLVFNNLDMLPQIAGSIGTLAVPWYHVIGNHDINFDTPDYAQEAETYARVFGPSYYSFNYGKVHFLSLNNIYWEVDNKRYHGEFGERQLRFIEADLALVPKDYLIVPMMHIPLQDVVDRARLFELMKPFANTFSLSAHWHRQSHYYMGPEEDWHGSGQHHHLVQGTACGSWWGGAFDELGIPRTTMSDGVPNGYAYITFEGAKYRIRYKAARRPASYQMNIAAPEVVAPDASETAEVVVNVFSGSARSTVRMRVAGVSDWVAMTQFTGLDPYYVRDKERERKLAVLLAKAAGNDAPDNDALKQSINQNAAVVGQSLPDPRETDHLWKAFLPANLSEGYHVIEVEAIDQFGQRSTSSRILRVAVGG